jgi:hypothetical protein
MTWRCPFCGEPGKRTVAHVLHQGIGRRLVAAEGLDPDVAIWSQWMTGVRPPTASSRFDHKAKAMCESCNSGWMEPVEREVESFIEPLVAGAPAVISGDQVLQLGRWLMMVTFLHMLSTPHDRALDPVVAFRALRAESTRLPPGTVLGIGHAAPELTGNIVITQNGFNPDTEAVDGSVVSTLGRLGRFVFVATSFAEGIVDDNEQRGDSRHMIGLWPRHHDAIVQWPPPDAIDSWQFGGMMLASLRMLLPEWGWVGQ